MYIKLHNRNYASVNPLQHAHRASYQKRLLCCILQTKYMLVNILQLYCKLVKISDKKTKYKVQCEKHEVFQRFDWLAL